MNDKCGQARRFRLVRVGAIWFMLLIGFWLFLPGYPLGAGGSVIPLPPGAVARLGLGTVNAVKYSPDGKYLAVASSIRIELRDAQTLKLVRSFQSHMGQVDSRVMVGGVMWTSNSHDGLVAFSSDGGMLASGSVDSTIRLWDVSTGKMIRTLTGHTAPVDSVAFSPDGRMLASGSMDDTVKLWDVDTGKLIRTLLILRTLEWVDSVAFSPDGLTLASGACDHTIKLWNVGTGKLIRTLTGHTGPILSVAFSPDGRMLASGSGDHTIKLWNVTTGKLIRTLTGHMDEVWSVAFSPNGRTLASGAGDETVKLWDVATGKSICTLEGHTGSVYSVAFSPDGQALASGSWDGTVLIWDMSALGLPQGKGQ